MIGFVGLSHLGTVSSICLSEKGFDIVAYDPDPSRASELNAGRLNLHEPGLPEILEKNVGHRIRFSSTPDVLNKCEVVYFSLDVATDENNISDLRPLLSLIDKTLPMLNPDCTAVILSQVPPGFTRELSERYKRSFYYQVETLIFGRAVERALSPERFIVGCARPKADLPEPLLKSLEAFQCPILKMRYESAELTKIAINLCLVSSISVANTMAEICEKNEADWTEIAQALKLDRRIGQYAYLSPGLGVAGGNLERDMNTISMLAKRSGTDSRVITAWQDNLRYRADWALRILQTTVLSKLKDPQIAIWGLAYKQDTKSTKNSPSLSTIRALRGFKLNVYDPQAQLTTDQGFPGLLQVESPLAACENAQVLMVLTPWKEFAEIDLRQVKAALKGVTVLDPYGHLNEAQCRDLGFDYFRLGAS